MLGGLETFLLHRVSPAARVALRTQRGWLPGPALAGGKSILWDAGRMRDPERRTGTGAVKRRTVGTDPATSRRHERVRW